MTNASKQGDKALVFTYEASGGSPIAEMMSIRMAQHVTSEVSASLTITADEPLEDLVRKIAASAAVLRETAEQLTADIGAIAVLNDMSVREVAKAAGINHDTMRRALSRSPTLRDRATGEGRRRLVGADGIAQAREDIREGNTPVGHWVNVSDLPDGTQVEWASSLGAFVVKGTARGTRD